MSPCGSDEIQVLPVRWSGDGHRYRPSFILIYITRQGLSWRPLGLLNLIYEPTIWIFQSFTGYDLRLSMWFSSFQQAQARRWWMGSLKFAIGSRASFHPKSCRRPLQFLPFSSRCPRAAGSESLKCFLFHSPTLGNFWKIFFKMSVCSRSVFMKICWKVATLGVLNSLSPAVFFLWLYYITALGFRLFADRTSFICNICA